MTVGSFGQGQKHSAMVFRIIDALNQAGFGQTIDQFDRGMMANTQPMREIPHRYRTPARKSLDRQQGLMLSRRQADALRRFLAEFEKAADQVTKLR